MSNICMAVAMMQGICLNWNELFIFHLKRCLLEMKEGELGDKHLKHILMTIWDISMKENLVTLVLPIISASQPLKEKGPVQEEELNRLKHDKLSTSST